MDMTCKTIKRVVTRACTLLIVVWGRTGRCASAGVVRGKVSCPLLWILFTFLDVLRELAELRSRLCAEREGYVTKGVSGRMRYT